MSAALAFVALLLPVEMPAPVYLPDLAAFRCVTRECAVANRDATQRHTEYIRTVMDTGFGKAGAAWECRQDEVWHAWAFLAGALNEQAPAYVRARNLSNLKNRIGADNYFAGVMPAPVPDYGAYPPLAPQK